MLCHACRAVSCCATPVPLCSFHSPCRVVFPVLSSATHTTACVQISRLTALLEASKLHAALSSEQLMADLADERMRSERLRAVRDDALLQRCGQQRPGATCLPDRTQHGRCRELAHSLTCCPAELCPLPQAVSCTVAGLCRQHHRRLVGRSTVGPPRRLVSDYHCRPRPYDCCCLLLLLLAVNMSVARCATRYHHPVSWTCCCPAGTRLWWSYRTPTLMLRPCTPRWQTQRCM